MVRRSPRSSSTSCAARSRSRAVKAPGFGDRRKAMLQDIAALTGGEAITEDLGHKLENLTLDRSRSRQAHHDRQGQHHDHRGRGQEGSDRGVASRQIRREIEETTSDYDREKLQERLAKLVGGVAVIRSARRPRSR